MKQLFAIFFTLSLNLVFAQQRITVIDKSTENALLFDEQNPQSLVSLFNNNSLPFNPMSLGTSLRLANEGLMENKPFKVGNQSDVALSTSQGEDSMVVFDGVLQFVYPMPDFYNTDLKDISRILLYEHDTISNGKQHFIIDSIGYSKKYDQNGKYELLGTIRFKAIDNEYQLFYLEELNAVSFQQLMASDFLSQIKTNQVEVNPMQTRPILNWNSGLSKNYYSIIFDILQPNRPRIYYWNNRDFHWPINDSKIIQNSLKDLEKKYGEGTIYGFLQKESDNPLANVNGGDSMVFNGGNLEMVFPERIFYPSWIDLKPKKAWLVYRVSSESLVPKNKLERILFTDSENVLLADFNCSDPRADLYVKYLQEAGIQLEVPVNENWKTALLKARMTGKHYSVSKKSDVKKLVKEFEVIEDVVH